MKRRIAGVVTVFELVLPLVLITLVVLTLEKYQRNEERQLLHINILGIGFLVISFFQFVAGSYLLLGLCQSDDGTLLKHCYFWTRVAHTMNAYVLLILLTQLCPKLGNYLPPLCYTFQLILYRIMVTLGIRKFTTAIEEELLDKEFFSGVRVQEELVSPDYTAVRGL